MNNYYCYFSIYFHNNNQIIVLSYYIWNRVFYFHSTHCNHTIFCRSSKMSKKTKEVDPQSSDSEEEEYSVEKILDKRIKGGRVRAIAMFWRINSKIQHVSSLICFVFCYFAWNIIAKNFNARKTIFITCTNFY